MNRKVLIPYYLGGAGHLSNARAIEFAIRKRFPSWEIKFVDPVEVFSAQSLNRLYVEDWKRILSLPKFFQNAAFGFNASFPGIAKAVNRRAISAYADACREYCIAEKPDLILSTHWAATQLFCEGRKSLNTHIPIWSLFYEFGGSFPIAFSDADLVFYITEEAGKALQGIGHAPERLREIDLMVQPDIKIPLPEKRSARTALGIDPERFTVLLSLGGEGIGKLYSFVDHYARFGSKAQLLVLTGRNTMLLNKLQKYLARNPEAAKRIHPFGFLPDIRNHLGAADLVAGKCGASIVSELICTRRPLAILQLGAPNEIANRDYLVERKYAWETLHPREFTPLVDRFASGDPEFTDTVARMEHASECTGAEQLADMVSKQFRL